MVEQITEPIQDMNIEAERVWEFSIPDIRFGLRSSEELAHELRNQGSDPPAHGLLITDQTLSDIGHPQTVTAILRDAGYDVDVFRDVGHEPTLSDIRRCVAFVRDHNGTAGYDFYVGLGGGSVMDTAKTTRAIVANDGEIVEYLDEPIGSGRTLTGTDRPLVLLPTTAGTGAEIADISIVSVEEQGVKTGLTGDVICADAAVIDPVFSVTQPPELTASSAMDVIGPAIEKLTTHQFSEVLRTPPSSRPGYPGRTMMSEMFSKKAIKLVADNLRSAVHNGENLRARANLMKATLFDAISGVNASVTLCHAMAYPVGNQYHTHHGKTIGVLAPATTLGYNVAANPEAFVEVAEMLGGDTAGMSQREAAEGAKERFIQLQKDLDVLPSGLNELAGITEDDVEELAERTMDTQNRTIAANPRMLEKENIESLYLEALHNW